MLKRNAATDLSVIALESGTLVLLKGLQIKAKEKLQMGINTLKIARVNSQFKIFCGDKMGQIWQLNAKNLCRESVGKVSGSVVKMSVDGRTESLIVITSTNLIVQLNLGEKKMRKKIGLTIRKNKHIGWKVRQFSGHGLGFLSEPNWVTFVDLRRKKVEKINADMWLGGNSALKDWALDRASSLMYLLSHDMRLVVLENRNRMKSMGPNDWGLVAVFQVAECPTETQNEYEFFDDNSEQKQGVAILGCFGGKVVIQDYLGGMTLQFAKKRDFMMSTSGNNLEIKLENCKTFMLTKNKKKIEVKSDQDILHSKWSNSRLIVHRWKQLVILDEQTVSGLFTDSEPSVSFEDVIESIRAKSHGAKQMSWVLDLANDYQDLGLAESGFTTLDSNNRLKLFDYRGKMRDEVRVDCKSAFDRLSLDVWRDSLLVGFNHKSFKVFKIKGGSLRLFLGGVTLQSIRDAVTQAYPHQKWKILCWRFSRQLDRLGCLLSASDGSAVVAVLSLNECKLGVFELDLATGHVPADIVFDRCEESIFGVRITHDKEQDIGEQPVSVDSFKICLMNAEGEIKKIDSVEAKQRVTRLEYPRLQLQNCQWITAGILKGNSEPISEEIRAKCVEFSRAIAKGKVERTLELAEEVDRRVDGRVMEKMMELCFFKKNATLAECTLNKMKFLRGKILLSRSRTGH